MRAIYKKEFKSYFTSMMGYVFAACFMIVVGIYFSAFNLGYSYPLIGYTLASVTFLFLIFVPILTMRSISEEQKNKTDQLLYTSPVSVVSIVAGKYFALVSVFAVPMLIISTFPLLLEQYGNVDMAQSYLSILGFFFLGAAYISVGLFISSITESQIIAAVISFGVLLFSYMVGGIAGFFSNTASTSLIAFSVLLMVLCIFYYAMTKNVYAAVGVYAIVQAVVTGLYIWKQTMFEGAIAKVLGVLDLSAASTSLIQDGILDLTDITFYLSVIGLFLFLTVQTIQKKRWN